MISQINFDMYTAKVIYGTNSLCSQLFDITHFMYKLIAGNSNERTPYMNAICHFVAAMSINFGAQSRGR